jgi:16S rRNA G966 N2-methylase RsmD
MIKTYSLPGETVLDMTVGSGTTAIAAINTGRKYICVEHDKAIYKRMVDRVRTHWHATAAWRRKHGEKMIADEMKAKEAFFKLLKQRGERGGGESERVRIAK